MCRSMRSRYASHLPVGPSQHFRQGDSHRLSRDNCASVPGRPIVQPSTILAAPMSSPALARSTIARMVAVRSSSETAE